ncbi:MAG TPA: inositol monophosphatase [Chloroflexia bacterium]|nr:inositol monophosphatase [Chloroflexia bacterium]
MSRLEAALEVAREAARAAGTVALQGFRGQHEITSKGGSDIVTQFDHAAEEAALAVIRKAFPHHGVLAEESGHTRVEAPEGVAPADLDLLWMVDPIDGTHNYAAGLPFWCVSVAAVDPDTDLPQVAVIYDPLHDETFSAARGRGALLNGKPLHAGERTELGSAMMAYDVGHNLVDAPRMLRLVQSVQPQVGRVRHLGSAALAVAYVAAGRLDGFYHLNLNPWDVAAGMLLVTEAGGVVTDWEGNPRSSGQGPVIAAGAGLHASLLALLRTAEKV